jgi:hypothetical protein
MPREIIRPSHGEPCIVQLACDPEGIQRENDRGIDFQYVLNQDQAITWLPKEARDAIVRSGARDGDEICIKKSKRGRTTVWEVERIDEEEPAPPPAAPRETRSQAAIRRQEQTAQHIATTAASSSTTPPTRPRRTGQALRSWPPLSAPQLTPSLRPNATPAASTIQASIGILPTCRSSLSRSTSMRAGRASKLWLPHPHSRSTTRLPSWWS